MNQRRNGIGSHQSAKMIKDEWLTPPEILQELGVFDLDPCSPIIRPWETANKHFTVEDNGLLQPWNGRVWCNPPYGKETATWLERCAIHGNCIVLIFARTETKMFFNYVWNRANGILFIKGWLNFHHANGTKAVANSGAPSALIAYGKNNAEILKNCKIKGKYLSLS